MRDFLGQVLEVGDYCTYPGAGNRKAEYGLVLHKIVEISDSGAKTQRLDIRYRPTRASYKTSRIRKGNKLTKIHPPPNMIIVFENPDDYPDLIGKWLHGQTDIDWETLTCEAC